MNLPTAMYLLMMRPYPGQRTFARWVIALFLLAGGLTGGPANAANYGIFIDVETEEDLRDLQTSGEITDSAYESLVQLLHYGVDLNRASREQLYALPNLTYVEVDAILDYRQEVGRISDPADLVAAGVIERRKLSAMASFLVVFDETKGPRLLQRGRLRYRTSYVAGDSDVPSMWIGADATAFRELKVGVTAALTRTRVSDVRYDPNRGALSAESPSPAFHLVKFYADWETDKWHLLGGTYRIGFAQRLTFDNTDLYTPNGIQIDNSMRYEYNLSRSCRESAGELTESPCAGDHRYEYRSPDYKWTDRLQGVAFGLKRAEVGTGWIQAYGFASAAQRGVYQYKLYDRARCADPHNGDDPACAAPPVYLRREDLGEPTSQFSYQTLSEMYSELLAGGNVSFFFNRRAHLGMTGYGSSVSWLTNGIELDFQEWARTPYGGAFGAMGIDGSLGLGRVDLFLELSRSFDGQPEGGGWAGILRGVAAWKKHEIEGVFRYYDQDYANPYARPVAEDDQYDGLRARDEIGARLRYTGSAGDLTLRSTADVWSAMSLGMPRLKVSLRANYELSPWLTPGIWFEIKDKDLQHAGRGACNEVLIYSDGEEEDILCQGEQAKVGVQAHFQPLQRLTLTAKYQHKWVDDASARFADSNRQDASAWLLAMYKPLDNLRLRTRIKYLHEDISSRDYREQSIWFYLEGMVRLQMGVLGKLRYEVYAWIDTRESSERRRPNPAHWFRLELEYQF